MKKASHKIAAIALAISAGVAAPGAMADDSKSASNPCAPKKQSKKGNPCGPSNPCGPKKRAGNPCGPSNPCGPKKKKAE